MSRPRRGRWKCSVSDLVLQVVRAGRDPDLVQPRRNAAHARSCFHFKELNRTLAAVGRRSPLAAHNYDVPPGNRALRVQVARRAMEAGCTLSPDDIITTVGATEALNLCLARRRQTRRRHWHRITHVLRHSANYRIARHARL